MKFRVNKNIRINGRNFHPGDIIELEEMPSILAGDLDQLDESTAELPDMPDEPNEPPLYRVGIFVTGRCNINCAHCSQAEFRRDYGDMDIEVAKLAVDKIKASGRRPILSITGGEPTLWPHLKSFLEYAKAAQCFPQVWMFSNGQSFEILDDLLSAGLITSFKTNAANCHAANCEKLKAKHPKQVSISNAGHVPLIKARIWNSLPAICHCPGVAIMGNEVFPCANFYSIIHRHKFDYESYRAEWVKPVNSDWIDFFLANEDKKYSSRVCQHCEANMKVRRNIHENVRRYNSGI